MADPTAYDLEQDQRIESIEDLVTVDQTPVDGAEYSFPIPNYPMNQRQFELLSLTSGNGIIDRGDGPYRLTGWGTTAETNSNNSMVLTVGSVNERAEAVVAGYYHVLTRNMTVPLPPVTSTTTYYVCLTYDPRNDGGDVAEGPVSVQVFTNTIPTTHGRVSVALHSVTRKPNQLLTAAAVEIFRPRVSPIILVGSEGSLPKPGSVLYGTVAVVESSNDIVVARNSNADTGVPTEWLSLTSPKWTDLADNQFYGWPGHGYRRGYRRLGSSMELRGRIKRMNNAAFAVGGGDWDQGYKILNLPEEYAPSRSMRFVTTTDGFASNGLAIVSVESDGSVYGMPLLRNATWIGLDGVRFDTK